ncbi:TMEM165/GDT1 family protein [Paraferrimonas sp. SM1919]|uniref:TMEM165/GDT1 family protein n=1 Tax=Paraferrimonas sp. SM1919 TaxID=2662263 RepID=UPI0013D86BDE|nr:TMEM165/GDT1 family protein [Paraferrimonas sp. SM1919]
MEALFTSTVAVAIAEIGDKTQLLAMLLAARFNNRLSLISGIIAATLLNHFGAGLIGHYFTGFFQNEWIGYVVGGAFIALGLWLLIPDEEDEEDKRFYKYGAFMATFVLFFLAEIGDKTQVATVLLAAKYEDLFMVVIGTTLGMLAANVPVIYITQFFIKPNYLMWIHRIAASLFIILGIITVISY